MNVYDVWVEVSRERAMTVAARDEDEAMEKARAYVEEHENANGEAEVIVTGVAVNLEESA